MREIVIGKEFGRRYWDGKWWVVHWYDETGKIHNQRYFRWWWEINVGEIPEGYVIAPIDGDVSNISEDNFECITFKENQRRTHGNYERTDEYKGKMSELRTGKKMSDEQRITTAEQTRKNWQNGVFDKVHKGEHSHRWRGGESRVYPKEFYEIRDFIVERDEHRCQACGVYVFKRKFGHVHHIDGDKNHNDEDNLILVCVTCHGQIHSKSYASPVIMSFRSKLYWNQ